MTFWRTVGALWALPAAWVTWVGYLLPAWWRGWVTFDGWARPGVTRWRVTSPEEHGHTRAWELTNGVTFPFAVILNRQTSMVTELRQLRKADQWLLLGVLYPVIYALLYLAEGPVEHSLEQDARDWARKEWAWHLRQEKP